MYPSIKVQTSDGCNTSPMTSHTTNCTEAVWSATINWVKKWKKKWKKWKKKLNSIFLEKDEITQSKFLITQHYDITYTQKVKEKERKKRKNDYTLWILCPSLVLTTSILETTIKHVSTFISGRSLPICVKRDIDKDFFIIFLLFKFVCFFYLPF